MIESITELVALVVPDVPGAPLNIIKQRLREALRQFCNDTNVWQEYIEVASVEGQASYTLDIGYDAYIRTILSVQKRTSEDQSFDHVTETNPHQYKINSDSVGFSFYEGYEPTKSLNNGIRVGVSLLPSIGVDELSGTLLERWYYAITSLAKSKLMLTAKTSYFSPQLAGFWATEYRREQEEAKRANSTMHKNLDTTVLMLGGLL